MRHRSALIAHGHAGRGFVGWCNHRPESWQGHRTPVPERDEKDHRAAGLECVFEADDLSLSL